jgi:hypothetical protein
MFSKFQSLPSYFGGKRKLVKYIFKPIKKKDGVFVDAFLGGGSVSLYAKAKGYKVISNDIALRSLIIGKAIISNNSVKLESEDLARLFIETKHDGFIKKNYCPKVFTTKIADFLDNAVVAARQVENETKRYLLLHLLIKFILSCRQFGKFTHTRAPLDPAAAAKLRVLDPAAMEPADRRQLAAILKLIPHTPVPGGGRMRRGRCTRG